MANVSGSGGVDPRKKDFRIEDPILEAPGSKPKLGVPNLEISETKGKKIKDRSSAVEDSIQAKVANAIDIKKGGSIGIDFNQLAEVFFMMAIQAREGAREGRLAQQESTQRALKSEEKKIRQEAWTGLISGLASAGLQTAGGAYGTFKGAQNLGQISQTATGAATPAATTAVEGASESAAASATTESIKSATASTFDNLDAQSRLTSSKAEVVGGVGKSVDAAGSALSTEKRAEQSKARAEAEKGRSAADTQQEFKDAMNKVVSDMLSMIQQIAQDQLATQKKIIENI